MVTTLLRVLIALLTSKYEVLGSSAITQQPVGHWRFTLPGLSSLTLCPKSPKLLLA